MSLLDLFLPVRVAIRGFEKIDENRGQRTGYNRAYYRANKERIQAQKRAYYERNRAKLLAKAKRNHEEQREARNAAKRARRGIKDVRRSRLYTSVPKADRPCCDCAEPRYVTPRGQVSPYCYPCKLARDRAAYARRRVCLER